MMTRRFVALENIAHYRELLRGSLSEEQRRVIGDLLAAEERELEEADEELQDQADTSSECQSAFDIAP